MPTRRKIPTGAGSYFLLTPKTLRLPIEGADGVLAAELLINAGGDGAIAIVPPGCKIPTGTTAARMGVLEAVELLRRQNLYRLSTNRPELEIPTALVRRAKAETVPGIEALVAFPGKLKSFYEGRGSWADTGLWVSADGEYELEMSAAVGFLRKRLTRREAELWLQANGHEAAWKTFGSGGPATQEEPDQWRIATRGHEGEGKRHFYAISWRPLEQLDSPTTPPTSAKDRELRAAIKRARPLAPPSISPPRKQRRPRRGK
jgi:hypothetical protein